MVTTTQRDLTPGSRGTCPPPPPAAGWSPYTDPVSGKIWYHFEGPHVQWWAPGEGQAPIVCEPGQLGASSSSLGAAAEQLPAGRTRRSGMNARLGWAQQAVASGDAQGAAVPLY